MTASRSGQRRERGKSDRDEEVLHPEVRCQIQEPAVTAGQPRDRQEAEHNARGAE